MRISCQDKRGQLDLGGSGVAPPPAPPRTVFLRVAPRVMRPRSPNLGGAASLLPQTPPPQCSCTWQRGLCRRVRIIRRRAAPLSPQAPSLPRLSVPVRLLEDAFELELAPHGRVGLHHLEARHGVVVDVPIGVEAPLAVYALEVSCQC